MKEKLELYYKTHNEDERLIRNKAYNIEFTTTLHFIEKYTKKNGRVIDVGAATGRYSKYLADRGFEVVAVDLVDKHVEILKSKGLNALQANALDLGVFEDEYFDSVLLLGPIYHLFSEEDIIKCIKEAKRICKKGGYIYIAYLPEYSVILDFALKKGNFSYLVENNLFTEDFHLIQDNGIFNFLPVGYLDSIINKLNIEKVTEVAVNGLAKSFANEIGSLSDKEFEVFNNYHLATCENPEMLGYSNHVVIIGKKN